MYSQPIKYLNYAELAEKLENVAEHNALDSFFIQYNQQIEDLNKFASEEVAKFSRSISNLKDPMKFNQFEQAMDSVVRDIISLDKLIRENIRISRKVRQLFRAKIDGHQKTFVYSKITEIQWEKILCEIKDCILAVGSGIVAIDDMSGYKKVNRVLWINTANLIELQLLLIKRFPTCSISNSVFTTIYLDDENLENYNSIIGNNDFRGQIFSITWRGGLNSLHDTDEIFLERKVVKGDAVQITQFSIGSKDAERLLKGEVDVENKSDFEPFINSLTKLRPTLGIVYNNFRFEANDLKLTIATDMSVKLLQTIGNDQSEYSWNLASQKFVRNPCSVIEVEGYDGVIEQIFNKALACVESFSASQYTANFFLAENYSINKSIQNEFLLHLRQHQQAEVNNYPEIFFECLSTSSIETLVLNSVTDYQDKSMTEMELILNKSYQYDKDCHEKTPLLQSNIDISYLDDIAVVKDQSSPKKMTLSISWICISILFVIVGLIFCFTIESPSGIVVSTILFTMSVITILGALDIKYECRKWFVGKRKIQCLQCALISALMFSSISVILYRYFRDRPRIRFGKPTHDSKQGCMKYSNPISNSFYYISDITTVGEDIWSVSAMSLVSWKNWRTMWTLSNVEIVSVSPGMVDSVFLGIENPFTLGRIHYFSQIPKFSKDFEVFKHRYNLTFKGMTAVKDQVLLPSKNGGIFVFEVDLYYMTAVLINIIPSIVVTNGLMDEPQFKEISSMYYDTVDSSLLILFGSSRVIRVLSWPNMALIQEWSLTEEGVEWSGITVFNKEKSKYIYLSQAYPSELWEFKLTNEGGSSLNGSFPVCANFPNS